MPQSQSQSQTDITVLLCLFLCSKSIFKKKLKNFKLIYLFSVFRLF